METYKYINRNNSFEIRDEHLLIVYYSLLLTVDVVVGGVTAATITSCCKNTNKICGIELNNKWNEEKKYQLTDTIQCVIGCVLQHIKLLFAPSHLSSPLFFSLSLSFFFLLSFICNRTKSEYSVSYKQNVKITKTQEDNNNKS